MKNETAKCACRGDTLTKFVQPIILCCLAQMPDHGYNLLQKIAHTELWKDTPPDPSGVYRVLRDMQERNLITSCVTQDSKASIGKRMFSITEEGRACMKNWVGTLTQYRRGIDETIGSLQKALGDDTICAQQCCCKSLPPKDMAY